MEKMSQCGGAGRIRAPENRHVKAVSHQILPPREKCCAVIIIAPGADPSLEDLDRPNMNWLNREGQVPHRQRL